jgi:hypothetical protein
MKLNLTQIGTTSRLLKNITLLWVGISIFGTGCAFRAHPNYTAGKPSATPATPPPPAPPSLKTPLAPAACTPAVNADFDMLFRALHAREDLQDVKTLADKCKTYLGLNVLCTFTPSDGTTPFTLDFDNGLVNFFNSPCPFDLDSRVAGIKSRALDIRSSLSINAEEDITALIDGFFAELGETCVMMEPNGVFTPKDIKSELGELLE